MAKKKKHPVLRVRRVNKTDRDKLSTMVIKDKKKQQNKNKCRRNLDV